MYFVVLLFKQQRWYPKPKEHLLAGQEGLSIPHYFTKCMYSKSNETSLHNFFILQSANFWMSLKSRTIVGLEQPVPPISSLILAGYCTQTASWLPLCKPQRQGNGLWLPFNRSWLVLPCCYWFDRQFQRSSVMLTVHSYLDFINQKMEKKRRLFRIINPKRVLKLLSSSNQKQHLRNHSQHYKALSS